MTIYSTLFLAAAPTTMEWSPKVAAIMIICNIVAIAFGKLTIKNQTSEPALPSPALFGGMGLPALLGVTSLGHIVGAGVILGLGSVGAL